MSDQEKTSGTVVGSGSLMVMVEQSTASRQKPYRPTILDEAPPDLHHKLSHAPVVPSMSSEKQKHIVAKKLSSAIKRPTSPIITPEKIAMAALEPEKKRAGSITPPSQPIPHVGPVAVDTPDCRKSTEGETKGDEDSITEEIAELRTADTDQKVSEWVNKTKNEEDARETEPTLPLQRKSGNELVDETVTSSQQLLKKKEITWSGATYVDKVQLQEFDARNSAWMLERKASIGPCYKKTVPYGRPSGIMISLPKKSQKNINMNTKLTKSGITITLSKKCINNNSRLEVTKENVPKKENKIGPQLEEEHCDILCNLKGKLDILRGKIRHVLHM